MAGPPPIWEAASKQYVDEKITAQVAATQFWLPAVESQTDLPTVTDTTKTWLCRVRTGNKVFQCVAGQTTWALYSSDTEYITEDDLDSALTDFPAVRLTGDQTVQGAKAWAQIIADCNTTSLVQGVRLYVVTTATTNRPDTSSGVLIDITIGTAGTTAVQLLIGNAVTGGQAGLVWTRRKATSVWSTWIRVGGVGGFTSVGDMTLNQVLGSTFMNFSTRNIVGDPRFPLNYANVSRFRSGPSGEYSLWFCSNGGRFFITMTADGADVTTSTTWNELLPTAGGYMTGDINTMGDIAMRSGASGAGFYLTGGVPTLVTSQGYCAINNARLIELADPSAATDAANKRYVDGANSYSTTETATGGIWTNGRPIYRRVMTATTASTLNTNTLVTGAITGFSGLVRIDGYALNTGSIYIPFQYSAQTGWGVYVQGNGQVGENHADASMSSRPMTIILEYVK